LQSTSVVKHKNTGRLLIAAFLVMLLSAIVALFFGSGSTSPAEILRAIFTMDTGSAAYRIFFYSRLPRVLGALLAGSALSVSGVIIQAVLNNSLASPNIIGVNTGAGFFVLLIAAFFPSAYFLLPTAAFAGALLACVIILIIAANASRLTLILTGFVISSIFTAGMNAIMIFRPEAYVGSGTFLVGGLSGLTMTKIAYPAIYIIVGLLMALLCGRDLNVISLGSDTATSLGMRVKTKRFLLLSVAAVLAGAAVSFAGLIGFVGLVIPHAARFIIGNDNKVVIPFSILLGGIFVALSDVLSRTLFAPYELPVGLLLAFVGCPFFMFLILKNKRKNYD